MLLGILLTVMGLQFITMGLLGELLVRTYHESQGKPVYRVDRMLRPIGERSAPDSHGRRVSRRLYATLARSRGATPDAIGSSRLDLN